MAVSGFRPSSQDKKPTERIKVSPEATDAGQADEEKERNQNGSAKGRQHEKYSFNKSSGKTEKGKTF